MLKASRHEKLKYMAINTEANKTADTLYWQLDEILLNRCRHNECRREDEEKRAVV